jgi:hypothetical protein
MDSSNSSPYSITAGTDDLQFELPHHLQTLKTNEHFIKIPHLQHLVLIRQECSGYCEILQETLGLAEDARRVAEVVTAIHFES